LKELVAPTALLAVALLTASCGDGGSNQACAGKNGIAGTRQVTIQSGGIERSFLLTVPDSALQRPVPLLTVFHGVFGDAEIIQAVTGFPQKAVEEGFITAAGNGTGESWNAGVCCNPASAENVDDVGFTRDMVAAIQSEYCIDESRIYATGFSNGAAMVFRLACEAADLFAAFAPVAGSVALFPCEPNAPRPIQIINNVSDPVVGFALGEFSFAEFVGHNACDATRETVQLSPTATCELAPRCAAGATTELCAVTDLGHQWPGGATNPDGQFDATDAVWEFLSAHGG
jgi:polyhydroxybutyrate depolymerase